MYQLLWQKRIGNLKFTVKDHISTASVIGLPVPKAKEISGAIPDDHSK